ncbi:MAG: Flp family type IVb pilin [Nocardioidaceae bacterium]
MISYTRHLVGRRRGAEQGASAVEYGLLVALIAALIVVSVYFLGAVVTNVFQSTCSAIASNGPSTASNASC